MLPLLFFTSAAFAGLSMAIFVAGICFRVFRCKLQLDLLSNLARVVAVLLGMPSSTLPGQFSTPAGEVQLITVKALLPSELTYLMEHGAEGQAELARHFAQSGEEHLSRVKRRAVV